MSDHIIAAITGIAIAVIGVAIIAILVSRQSETSNVLGAGGSTFADMLACAMSPVTGKACKQTARNPIEQVTSTLTF